MKQGIIWSIEDEEDTMNDIAHVMFNPETDTDMLSNNIGCEEEEAMLHIDRPFN